jgi:pilus assembly protein CpaE
MPQGVQHRIVLVGVEDALQPLIRAALSQRLAEPAVGCRDLTAALDEAHAHPTDAHLFIVQLSAEEDPARLSALTGSLPGQPVMVLLPVGADLARLLAAQRAGAAQVVPLPWQADDFLRALDCMATQFAPPAREARVLAVCGVSGGAGATTIALNLAFELVQTPGLATRRNVVLVELARQMGTLATYLSVEPPVTVHDLLSDPSRLTTQGVRQALTTVAPGLDVLVGPYQDIHTGSVSARHVFQLIELCRRLAAVVVLDVPAGFDDLQFETLALADQVVLVGVQSVSSVRTLKMVRETLEREEGLRGVRLVVNRYEASMPGFSAARLAELLQVPQVHTVANDYPSVMSALNHGKPLQLAAPHSRVLADVRGLAASLSGAKPTNANDQGDRLARALGRVSNKPAAPRALQVLHIEDDRVQQQAVALHLATIKEFTCEVTSVTSEADAIKAFAGGNFDVVLLDYQLEQGNGLTCLRQLRTMDANVAIIVVSGLTEGQIAAELIEAGAADFLGKANLSSERLGQSLHAAVSSAAACKQRLQAGGDTFLDRVRRVVSISDEEELLKSLHALQQTGLRGQFSASQIQRLVDLVYGELATPIAEAEPSRRALLTLFLRLFGSAGKSGSADAAKQ